MEKKWDVLGIGAVAVDDLLFVEQFPLPDSKERVVKLLRQGGGQAGTALVAAARLGVRTAYCGVLGDDELSLFVLEGLTREGVDCELVHKQTGAQPAHGTIIVECSTGRRIVLSYTAKVVEPPSELISEELIASCRVLLVDHLHLNASILAAGMARRQGIPVVVDLEVRGNPRLPDLVALADHLIIGINAARQLTGCEQPEDMVAALARTHRQCTVVTAGEKGCWYTQNDGAVKHFPAYQVVVVDTTGCGDVFHGAYAASIARGLKAEEAVSIASAAAGLKAAQPGGQAGIADWQTVKAFMARR